MIFKSKADKYYQMSKDELRAEAEKWNIRNYSVKSGEDLRQNIIDALLKKDNANQFRWSFIISIVVIIVSLVAVLK